MFRIKISPLLILLVMMATFASAQQRILTNPWSFQSIANVGLLEGETGSSFQLQTINGARYKSWFAGVGLGLDYYRYRTIPLFIDFRKEFGRGNGKLFIYADGGLSFGWVTDAQKTGYLADDQYHNGFYSDLGLGYKTSVGKKNALLFSLGYSCKKINETYTANYYSYTGIYYGDPAPDTREQISYNLNRLSIKMGWIF